MNLQFVRTYMDTNERPSVFERLKGNMYLYRYDIQQEAPVETEDSEESLDRYSFVAVQLKGYPNSNEVIKCMIRMLLSLEDELKLLNDYNESIIFGEPLYDDSEYIQYLTLRRLLKTVVSNDFKNNKI